MKLDRPAGLAGRRSWKRSAMKAGVIGSMFLWAGDIAYRAAGNISYMDRDRCILFRLLPRPGFLIYEYVFETLVIVLVGTFVAVLLTSRFKRFRRFLPGNPAAAFCYGSLIPVCSCAAIPLLSCTGGRMRFPTTLAFVVAAPLLSPHIIVLSFGVLGFRYAILRILSSFVLVMLTAMILGLFERGRGALRGTGEATRCDGNCPPQGGDIYSQTFSVFKRLLPFLLVAGGLGVLLEYSNARSILLGGLFGDGIASTITWILVGIPLYFCHGAEVLFLRPLVNHGFPLGTAIAFSLTSTAICMTSIAMLMRLMGTRLTAVLVGCIIAISLGLAVTINSI
jgi:uncharacterized membrane protein YraQ (UPF0718 family)